MAAAVNTGLEHGPQTYLAAVASRAAMIEASPTDHEASLGESSTRADAIELAFALTGCPREHENHLETPAETAAVRRILQAGDHCAALALARAGSEGWSR